MAYKQDFLFTSESVSEGHPDKVADQISDAILDAILAQDKYSRVACETYVKTGMVLVGGEISTTAWVDVEEVSRRVIRNIGYTNPQMGFDSESCAVLTAIGKQSPDIAIGVDESQGHAQGAGDQGIMFGYASDETETYMPAPIYFAHELVKRQAMVRKNNILPWLRPDAKSQVTFKYLDGKPHKIDTVLISTQHNPEVNQNEIIEAVIEEIIKKVLPANYLDSNTRYLVNPTGRFVIGGPQGDCGLTGRKIIVDTYGGMAHHGGGAFSGKDPSKVDRSAAYMARYLAKNIVAAGLAQKCEIQLSYAIGIAEPTSIYLNTFGTGRVDENKIIKLIQQNVDLTPKGIINKLDLLRPIYFKTASYGHFGRNEPEFTWEKLDLSSQLIA